MHTPGPWKIAGGFDFVGRGRTFPSVVLSEGCRIIINEAHDHKAHTIMANARLIAAAPDLLNAAKQALSDMKWVESLDERNNLTASIILLEYAINKAEEAERE